VQAKLVDPWIVARRSLARWRCFELIGREEAARQPSWVVRGAIFLGTAPALLNGVPGDEMMRQLALSLTLIALISL
jgi:hypothetical protein